MAFIHPDIGGMNHLRSKPLIGRYQPHVPNRSLSADARKEMGTAFFKETATTPPPGQHYHKRAAFGGKPAQSLLANSAYYAGLTQRYCMRSSLTGLERHGRGVEMLRTAGHWAGNVGVLSERPSIATPQPHLRVIHPKSLLASKWGPGSRKAMSIGPGCMQPEMVSGAHIAHAGAMIWRRPGLHSHWITAFDAEGGCIETADGEGAARDTKLIAEQSRDRIRELQHQVKVRKKNAEEEKRSMINKGKADLNLELKALDTELKDVQNARIEAARKEKQQKQALREEALRRKQLEDQKTRERYEAGQREANRKKKEAEAALIARRQAVANARNEKLASQGRGQQKRQQQVNELKELSLRAKRGSIDYGDTVKDDEVNDILDEPVAQVPTAV